MVVVTDNDVSVSLQMYAFYGLRSNPMLIKHENMDKSSKTLSILLDIYGKKDGMVCVFYRVIF